MAIKPDFTHEIKIPFAENGLKEPVISAGATVPINSITMISGYTEPYKTPLDEGGYSIEMEKFNYILWKAYSAIKELQALLTSGQFTAQEAVTATSAVTAQSAQTAVTAQTAQTAVTAQTAQTAVTAQSAQTAVTAQSSEVATTAGTAQSATTITSTLPINKGGTGATTAAQARINLGISGTSKNTMFLPDYTQSRRVNFSNADGTTLVSYKISSDIAFIIGGGSLPNGGGITITINGVALPTGINGTGGAATPSGIVFLPVRRTDTISTDAPEGYFHIYPGVEYYIV